MIESLVAFSLSTAASSQESAIEIRTSAFAVVGTPAQSGQLMVTGHVEDSEVAEAEIQDIAQQNGVEMVTAGPFGDLIWTADLGAEAGTALVFISARLTGEPQQLMATQAALREAGYEQVRLAWQAASNDTGVTQAAIDQALGAARELASGVATAQECELGPVRSIEVHHPTAGDSPSGEGYGEVFGVSVVTGLEAGAHQGASSQAEPQVRPMANVSARVSATFVASCPAD